MGIHLKSVCGMCILALLSAVSFAGPSADLRVVEAARGQNREAVRSLLEQHADVNAPQSDGATALAWAAHGDDLEMAELLIRAGANLNAANDYGVTPLSLACANGSAAMVEKLLQAGANTNTVTRTGETPLMACASIGNPDAVKLLLTHKADVNAKEPRRGQTALMLAAAHHHPDVTRALIEYGADIHARSNGGFTPLLFAARQGDTDSARILLQAGADMNEAASQDANAFVLSVNQVDRGVDVHEGAQDFKIAITPLLVASAGGHEALAIFLLEKGADPNVATKVGMTPLHYAVLKGFSIMTGVQPGTGLFYQIRSSMKELIKALLAHGANPNSRLLEHLYVNDRTIGGATPYLLAAASADAEAMRLLVAGGADPRMTTEMKTTGLMLAAGVDQQEWSDHGQGEGPSLEAVKAAMELGTDVNAANTDGRTALHGAADTGLDGVIEYLVQKGANVDAKDKYNQTPLSLALSVTLEGLPARKIYIRSRVVRQSAADLLLKLGAKPLTDPMYAGLLPPAPGVFPLSAYK
jgi:uncharacterized protein